MSYFNPDDYIDVQTRINRFWTEYPDGAIRTLHVGPVEDFTRTRYRAEVYKDKTNPNPDAVGYAFELAGQGMANKTSHEENCETSAIGRALANMGYATSGKDRPSREEMEKVQRHQESPPLPPEPEWAHDPSQQVSRAPAASQAPQDARQAPPQQRNGTPTIQNPAALATEKQVGYLKSLAQRAKYSDEDLDGLIFDQTNGQETIDTLTKGGASACIKWLQEQLS